MFVGALAGVGYVDPASRPERASQEFEPGQPVFDAREAQAELERRMRDQAEREATWRRAARPGAGAWMRDHRDDGARRVAQLSADDAAALARADEDKLRLYERNTLRGLEQQAHDLRTDERNVLAEMRANDALLVKVGRMQQEADASYADALAAAETGSESAPPAAAVTVLIDPRTGKHDERIGMSAADVASKGKDLETLLRKTRDEISDVERQIDEARRRVANAERA